MQCKDFHGEIHDVPEEEFRTRASIYGIIFNEDNTKVLLVKHLDGYDYPGGGLKIGQGIEEALGREITEETGYDLRSNSTHLLHVATDLFYHNFKNAAFQTILVYYAAALSSFDNKKEAEKSASEEQYMGDAEWVLVDDVPSLKFYNAVDNVALIQQALERA
jgi:ADP-ribose pyrophosphatase YjhB (NUDIX family)